MLLQSNFWYKSHQIQNCFSFYVAVVYAQSIEARGQVENEDVVGVASLPNPLKPGVKLRMKM